MRRRFSPSNRRGFTLPELLLSTAIIGTLSAASVVSYSTVRSRTRDVARTTDVKQFQTAMSLHLDVMGGYPGDGVPGPRGIYLGEGEFTSLSEDGWGPKTRGTIFMLNVPKNPIPFGTHYVYRSLNDDGSDCNAKLCPSYAILFATERNRDELPPGIHAINQNGFTEPKGFFPEDMKIVGAESGDGLSTFESSVTETAERVVQAVNDPRVQAANEIVVGPSVAAVTALNTAYASSQFGQYLLLFLSQPAALLGMKRRKKWGTVYNAVSRMPVDLAIVRLRNADNGRVIKSTVTDAEGRYSFLVPKGRYKLEAAKVGLAFPSVLNQGKSEDGVYHDLYHGAELTAEEGGGLLTPNVPMDPPGVEVPDKAIIEKDKQRQWHRSLAATSPFFGAIVFLMRPTVFVGLLFAAEVVLYFLFKRLAQPPEPKNWGTVYDKGTRRPVVQAVVRIFSAKYNKLLETQVTDAHGRYHFRVMGDVFFMTVTKNGYRKTETDPFDLRDAKTPVVVASDLPLASATTLTAAAKAAPKVGGDSLRARQAAVSSAAPNDAAAPAAPKPVVPAQTYKPEVTGDAPTLPASLLDMGDDKSDKK